MTPFLPLHLPPTPLHLWQPHQVPLHLWTWFCVVFAFLVVGFYVRFHTKLRFCTLRQKKKSPVSLGMPQLPGAGSWLLTLSPACVLFCSFTDPPSSCSAPCSVHAHSFCSAHHRGTSSSTLPFPLPTWIRPGWYSDQADLLHCFTALISISKCVYLYLRCFSDLEPCLSQ